MQLLWWEITNLHDMAPGSCHFMDVGEDDLQGILEFLFDVSDQWEYFGMALGLREAELAVIKADHFKVKDKMKAMALAWLQLRGKTPVSWKTLCGALKHPSVGRPDIALKIEDAGH